MTITVEPCRLRYCMPIPRMWFPVNLMNCTSLVLTSIASSVKKAVLEARVVIDVGAVKDIV